MTTVTRPRQRGAADDRNVTTVPGRGTSTPAPPTATASPRAGFVTLPTRHGAPGGSEHATQVEVNRNQAVAAIEELGGCWDALVIGSGTTGFGAAVDAAGDGEGVASHRGECPFVCRLAVITIRAQLIPDGLVTSQHQESLPRGADRRVLPAVVCRTIRAAWQARFAARELVRVVLDGVSRQIWRLHRGAEGGVDAAWSTGAIAFWAVLALRGLLLF